MPENDKLIYSFKPSMLAASLRLSVAAFTFLIPFLIIVTAGQFLWALGIGTATCLIFGGKAANRGLKMCFSNCNLYTKHLEYKEGWITIQKRVLKYENVVDVSYEQGVIDRLLNHGYILITTKGMERALELDLIGSPDKRYRILKQVISLSKNNPALLDKFTKEEGPINISE